MANAASPFLNGHKTVGNFPRMRYTLTGLFPAQAGLDQETTEPENIEEEISA